NNMSQILASVAGNVFGMKAVESLRLEDIKWPQKIIRSFRGPQFGIKGVRKIFKVYDRPLTLSVPKPKVGMTTKEHADIGYQIWTGGLDLLKDDENLTSQKFNPFQKRVALSLKMRDKAERETGEKKSYLINVTAPTFKEMEKRVKFVADHGNEFVMVDIITTGWMGVNSLRELCQDHHLAIHAHRAMHGAFTRNHEHGFSMLLVAEIARIIGVDSLHIGTAGVGKLVGSKEEVLEIEDHIVDQHIQARLVHEKLNGEAGLHSLDEEWYGTKPVFPVTSGGLHPGIIAPVLDRISTDVMAQFGGGVHGHPKGSHAGAKACRQAIQAYLDGVDVADYAKKHVELAQALRQWGKWRPR
ncbi:type III ribulose-bisphosphate carboxylase, partial [Candidatus Woesearchaeota archaeon]|nr:type III ribulose-bisphosphate carboxylase [Candidatus Woesearchaeota archaeon]